jgi:acetyl esterase
MNLEPKAQAFVRALEAANLPPFHAGTPEQARALAAGMKSDFPVRRMARVEDHATSGADAVPLRLYVPEAELPAVILYLHGGGWMLGSIETTDLFCREMARVTGCAVVAVDYRLAPEHAYPAALEDSYAALLWLDAQKAKLLGRDLPVVTLGDSAGGNLATVVARLAAERGGPKIALQILAYPVTDFDLETGSYKTFKDGPLLTRDTMAWFWRHYIPDEAQRRHPNASPLRAPSLAGMPPAFVLTAENDPLRDEGEAYAAALQKAGVTTLLKRYEGQIHGFLTFVGMFDGGEVALQDISLAIKDRLSRLASEGNTSGAAH